MNEKFKTIISFIIKSSSLVVTYKFPEHTFLTAIAEMVTDTLISLIPESSKFSTKKLANYIFETMQELCNMVPKSKINFYLSKKELSKLNYDDLNEYISNLSFDFDENKEANLIFSFRFTQALLKKAEKDQFLLNYLVNIYITNIEKEIIWLVNQHHELEKDVDFIKKYLKKSKQDLSVKIISRDSVRPKTTYVNRLEIAHLKQEIEKNDNYIVVSGIGGIGKTELCKKVFWDYFNNKNSNSVKYLAWINYGIDFQSSLLNAFSKYVDKEKTVEESINELCVFLNSLGTSLLLFVDNANKTQIEDNSISIIRKLACRIVITTRVDIFCEKASLQLGKMSNEESKLLFYKNFRYKIDDSQRGVVDKLIELSAGHTLTIELLAKIANQFTGGIMDLYYQLVENNFKIPDLDKAVAFEENETTIINHLKKVFNVVQLSNYNKNTLLRLAIIPYDQYTKLELLGWRIADNDESFIILDTLGWINNEYGYISMHPIISQVIINSVSKTYNKLKGSIKAISNELEIHQSTNYFDLYRTAMVGEYMANILHFESGLFAEFLNNVAVILVKSEERKRAMALYYRAIEIKLSLDSNQSSLSSTYNNLSIALKGIDYEKSLYYAQKSLEIEENLFESHPDIQAEHYAITLNNFGLSHMNLSKINKHDLHYINAEKAFLKAIKIRKQYKLDEHGYSQLQNNMGLLYSKSGDLYKGLIMHMLAVSDTSSPNIAIHKYNLGKSILYIHEKNYMCNSLGLIREIGVVNLEQSLEIFMCNKKMNKSRILRVIEQLRKTYLILNEIDKIKKIDEFLLQLNS